MTKDKFTKLSVLCCEFQEALLLQIADELDNSNPISSTSTARKLSYRYMHIADQIEEFLSEAREALLAGDSK